MAAGLRHSGIPTKGVGRPNVAKTLPKALPADLVAALLAALSSESEPRRRSEWTKRDRTLILTGLRADEMLRANVGDLRRTDDGPSYMFAARAARTGGSRSNQTLRRPV